MHIGIAADHAGLVLKEELIKKLHKSGHQVEDFGPFSLAPEDDYPDYVIPLSRSVANGEVERGIAICGSGVGACVTANKVRGVRAALVHDIFSAHQGVEDDNMNVICFGASVLGFALAWDLTEAFLEARFIGAERHQRRLNKITTLEN
jgi:RpiB/LacA/LacB family sugar-phosphate isomerase